MRAFTLLLLALLLALIPISTCAGEEVKVLSDADIELATNLQSTLSGRINGTGQPFPATGMSEELRHFATQALLARQRTYLECKSCMLHYTPYQMIWRGVLTADNNLPHLYTTQCKVIKLATWR